MTEKTLNVIVQYTRQAQAVLSVRPYEVKTPVSAEIQLGLTTEPLDQPGHHRVELQALVTGRNTEGVTCYQYSAAVEGIVASSGLEDEELDTALRFIAAPAVFGGLRSVLTSLSSGTGFSSVVLPPLSAEAVSALQPLPAVAGQ